MQAEATQATEAPCPAPAELIVFRGPTKRVFLCGGHRDRYKGRGRVCPYATADDFAEDRRTQDREPTFYGPIRICGETVE